MNRFLWAVLTLLVFAAPGVAGAANTVSLTLPECRRPATVPPPRHPPAGYSLVRTDRVDWNADGWCDLAYFFAPTNPTERRHLGGYAVDFFIFAPPAGWQRVTRMTFSSGHCDYVDSHTPFPTPDSLFEGGRPSPSSHYLMGDVGWVDNPRVGVLMVSDDRFFQWHEATTGPEFSELSGENANVMSASLIVARELRTLNRLLRTPDFKTLDQLDFSTFGSSPDLRICGSFGWPGYFVC